MKIKSQHQSLTRNSLIELHGEEWLDKQRVAGKVSAGALCLLRDEVKQGTDKSLLELNQLAEEYIQDHHCSATFKNYVGHNKPNFPTGCCISVNQQLVHGVPTDYHLQEGDIVSFDLGATFEGAIADNATTCLFGNPKSNQHVKLLEATKAALQKAIETIEIGKRIGCIGNAIFKSARGDGFSVITQYGGHGISTNKPHAEPFIFNKAFPSEGVRFQAGMTLAIEPLLVIGSDTRTFTDPDDHWTVSCYNLCAHEEKTIFVHTNGQIEIMTGF